MIDRRQGAAGFWTPERAALALIGPGIAGLVLPEIRFRGTTPEPRWANLRYLEISRDFEELETIERVYLPLGKPDPGNENLAAMIRVYTSNVRMLRATCDAFEVRCSFLLQPLLLTKTPLSGPVQAALGSLEGHPHFGPDGVRFVREFYQRHVPEQPRLPERPAEFACWSATLDS